MGREMWLVFAGGWFLVAWLISDHYQPWMVAYSEFASFIATIFLIFSLFGTSVKVSASALLTCCLAAVPLLQGLLGLVSFAGDAAMAAAYLMGFSAVLVAGNNLVLDSNKISSVFAFSAWILIAGANVSAWIALRQWFMLADGFWELGLPPGGRPFANFAQPNNLATFLCMGLVAVLYLFEKRILGAVSAGLMALFMIFGVALTMSRTPWLGGLCVLLWWAWKSRYFARRLLPIFFAAWVAVYVLAVLCVPLLAEALLLPIISLGERAQAMQRLDIWWQLWQALMQGPLWGYGWNQVSVAQVSVAIEYPVPIFVEHSHNILLDLLLWNGPVLGGVIILVMGAWLVRLGWRARTTESVIALLAVGFVLVHGMLEFPLEYAFFLFPVGFLLGMVEADQQIPALFTVPRWMHAGAIVVSVVVLGLVWQEYRLVEEDYRLMRFESARIGSLKAEQKAPNVVLLTQLREFIRFARTEAREGMGPGELDWMRKVVRRYPYPSSLFRYALALGLNQQPTAAYEQMLILRSLHGDERYEEGLAAVQAMLESNPQLEDLLAHLEKTGS